ncbi:MAG: enoyl-CoA hydratase/isomerase family protein [Deltaproteobacteria bacterium]|nr:enoyl-CoA hydratase/isomerase family protein [Deltaproteobacteria bacterium]MBW2362332.1 enoyl-CoA hydratase/isomerase family protein [Deltaproteobacteria bacterium]
MSYETLLFDVTDGVAQIRLNREKAANALNLQMCRDLQDAALRCRSDAGVRAVVIGAEGKMFCAGGDLGAFSSAADAAPRLLKEMTIHLHAAVSLFARMDAPVIGAVTGTAAGAGFSLVAAMDIAIAGESAKFTMAYTRAGLTPDGSSTWFLPRLVGVRRSLELMLTNRLLKAPEALEWGIVNQVVPDDAVLETATRLASQLAQGPTGAFGVTKRLVLAGGSASLETQMEMEGDAIAAASGTPSGREGIAAFLEKRPARFV